MAKKNIPISTSVEQSIRLIRAGLPKGTADMFRDRNKTDGNCNEQEYVYHHEHSLSIHQVPTWSLSKLINMLPNEIDYPSNDPSYMHEAVLEDGEIILYDSGIQYELRIDNWSVRYVTCDGEKEKFRSYSSPLLSAVVDTIEWLLRERQQLNL